MINRNTENAIFLGGTLLIALLFYVHVFVPATRGNAWMRREIETRRVQLRELETLTMKLEKMRAENRVIKQKLDEFNRRLPEDRSIDRLFGMICDTARDSELTVKQIQPLSAKTSGGYTKIPFRMEVEGGFREIYDFVVEVERLSRLIIVDEINVKRAVRDGGRADTGAARLRADMVLATYIAGKEKAL